MRQAFFLTLEGDTMSIRIPLENALGELLERESWRSKNIGMSRIASECERALWYQWRWAGEPVFSARTLRRFKTGDIYEDRLIAELKEAGFEVLHINPRATSEKKQYSAYWYGGLLSGKMDAFVRSTPEFIERHKDLGVELTRWHVLEIKAKASGKYQYEEPPRGEAQIYDKPIANRHPRLHPTAAGNEPDITGPWWQLSKKGLLKTDKVHYGQVQAYMGSINEIEKSGKTSWQTWGFDHWPDRALYLAANTDTDQLYAEIIGYDPKWWVASKRRAMRIASSDVPPERVKNNALYPPCSFCDYKPICHLGEPMEVNCRTCKHVDVAPHKYAQRVIWACGLHKRNLEDDCKACDQYEPLINVIDF